MEKLLNVRLLILIFFLSLLILPISDAQAAMVKTSFTGEVTEDNNGTNPFGLFNGEEISGYAIYDDAEVIGTSADEDLFVDDYTGWDFSITLGTFTFTQSDVTDPTYTSFWFNMGDLDGIEFFIDPIYVGIYLNLLIEDFDAGRRLFVEDADSGDPVYLEAVWDFENATTAPVPIPGTLLLLSAGLLGVVGLRKKNQKDLSQRTGNMSL